MSYYPKFSVIIPCYNASSYLQNTLSSVLNSSLKDIEVICINDASPDSCQEILQTWSRRDPRIKIINFEYNQGVASARNAGLDNATGEIIGFVDSDDTIDKHLIYNIYHKMQETGSDINLISFKFCKNNKQYYYNDLEKFIDKFGSDVQKMDTVEKLTMLDDYCWRLAIRRSFWEKNKIYFPVGIKGSEDQCFWKPQELIAEKVSFLNTYEYNYYFHTTSLTKHEMSSIATIYGHDELIRRLPLKYHLRLMEKCCRRIHSFKMNDKDFQNNLKRAYVARVYAKAKELGKNNYELEEYNYSVAGIYKVVKTKNKKKVFIGGIPLYKVVYSDKKKKIYIFGIRFFSKHI